MIHVEIIPSNNANNEEDLGILNVYWEQRII